MDRKELIERLERGEDAFKKRLTLVSKKIALRGVGGKRNIQPMVSVADAVIEYRLFVAELLKAEG